MEHSGEAFCCEFFVEPQGRLGHLLETPLGELAASGINREFARGKERLCSKCLVCRHLALCRGGCVKDRTRLHPDQPGQSCYFCDSYRQFFDYAVPRFMQIAAAVKRGMLARRTRSAEDIRLQL